MRNLTFRTTSKREEHEQGKRKPERPPEVEDPLKGKRVRLSSKHPSFYYYNKSARGKWNRASQVVEGMRWNAYKSSGKETPLPGPLQAPEFAPAMAGRMRERKGGPESPAESPRSDERRLHEGHRPRAGRKDGIRTDGAFAFSPGFSPGPFARHGIEVEGMGRSAATTGGGAADRAESGPAPVHVLASHDSIEGPARNDARAEDSHSSAQGMGQHGQARPAGISMRHEGLHENESLPRMHGLMPEHGPPGIGGAAPAVPPERAFRASSDGTQDPDSSGHQHPAAWLADHVAAPQASAPPLTPAIPSTSHAVMEGHGPQAFGAPRTVPQDIHVPRGPGYISSASKKVYQLKVARADALPPGDI